MGRTPGSVLVLGPRCTDLEKGPGGSSSRPWQPWSVWALAASLLAVVKGQHRASGRARRTLVVQPSARSFQFTVSACLSSPAGDRGGAVRSLPVGGFQCPPRGGLWAPMWSLPQGDTWQWDNGLKCRSDCNPGKKADPGACGAWRRACLLCVGDSGRLHGGGDFGAGTIWQVIKKWQLVPRSGL